MAGDGEAPLLERKPRVYFDGCPGCAVERRKAENSGVPYWQFFHIWIIILVSCLPISLLFPFIYFMAYAVEICRTEHQAIGLSLVSTSWAIGLIIGPAIGGYLAQIFSLWAESDKKYGGLSFTSEDVGQVLAITGASILLYQTFIYPQIVKVLGPVNASRVAAVTIVTCSFILQNNSVPQDQRATANGLATTLMSFFKAFAPAGAGIV
nr:unnamed protein product [Digitaria exilis]